MSQDEKVIQKSSVRNGNGNNKLLVTLLCAVIGGSGLVGVGSYTHLGSVSDSLDTKFGILTEKVDNIKNKVDQLEQDIKTSQSEQRLNQIHIEFLSKMSELSDRITHIEAKTNGKAQGRK